MPIEFPPRILGLLEYSIAENTNAVCPFLQISLRAPRNPPIHQFPGLVTHMSHSYFSRSMGRGFWKRAGWLALPARLLLRWTPPLGGALASRKAHATAGERYRLVWEGGGKGVWDPLTPRRGGVGNPPLSDAPRLPTER